ncbi:hypothetical protein GNF80_10735 [Clostridium perfringens]|nr:hypothetical protein [Clostridium perfringens]
MGDRKFSEGPKNKRTKIIWGIIILVFIIFLGVCAFRIKTAVNDIKATFQPSKELINETVSSDGKYKVQAYRVNGGVTTDWAVECYLKEDNNPKEKLIYKDYHIKDAEMTWIDSDTISINGHDIDLPNGKYDFRKLITCC